MRSATVNYPQNIALAPGRVSWLAYGRALTITIWLFSLVLNYWWRQEWDDVAKMVSEGVNLKGYYYIGFSIALAGQLTLGPSKWIKAIFALPSTLCGALFCAFLLLSLVLAPISVNPKASMVYALATVCVLLVTKLFWETDYHVVRRVLTLTGALLFGWLFILLLHHGMPKGLFSTIGGINRNTIGTLVLAAMICMQFANHRMLRLAAIGLAVSFLIIVTSRGCMLALGVFVAVYYILLQGTARAVGHALLGFFLAACVLLASSFLQKTVFEDVLRINDPNRGVGSGFTGRVDNWKGNLEKFRKRPILGHGFRSTASLTYSGSAHSGYIALLVDSGIIGATLVVGAVGTAIIQRTLLIQKIRPLAQQAYADPALQSAIHLNLIVVATLCTALTLWIYEPLYINLGNVMSVMFFLMFTAPQWPVSLARQAGPASVPRYAGAYR